MTELNRGGQEDAPSLIHSADMTSGDDLTATSAGDSAAEVFWLKRYGHEKICIAVLDGAVDTSHPCFSGAKLRVLGNAGEQPSGHGTHTASLIFGQPGSALRGIAPRCRGLLITAFHNLASEGQHAALGCTQLELAQAIRLAVDEGAHVINISGGRIAGEDEARPELVDAVQLCKRRNVLVVAAAGNDGCRCLHVPAALHPVLAVGAADDHGEPMDWSNWGDAYRNNGVMAPGKGIVGARVGDGIQMRDGTSSATAIVSGIAAILLSIQLRRGMAADPLAVRQVILDSCDPRLISDSRRALAGMVRAHEAAKLIRPDGPSTRVPTTGGLKVRDLVDSQREDFGINTSEHSPGNGEVTPFAAGDVRESTGTDAGAEEALVHAASCCDPAAVVGEAKGDEATASSEVTSSDRSPWAGGCSCGGTKLVYFIGELGINFGQQARLDSFAQTMKGSPYDTNDVLKHLKKVPFAAPSIVWTIGYESIPVYAVAPSGSYGAIGYDMLRGFLDQQVNHTLKRVAIPGVISGTAKLLCGPVIPVIVPDLRGVQSWDASDLPPGDGGAEDFLNRVFYELRSPGVDADDRAINFAATDGFVTHQIFKDAKDQNLALERIRVMKSPICRPGSICRDVHLTFFDPTRRFEQARKVFRLTVDVSDTVPARIGEVRSWHVY